MAKRRARTTSVDTLIAELRTLDARRKVVTGQIQQAISSLMGGENPFPWAPTARRGRPAGSKNKTKGARKGRRKMSAAARKAISDAQKKRWAKQKAGKK